MMMVRTPGGAAVWMVLAGWLASLEHPAAGREPGCTRHALETSIVKDRLRRWPGLAPFHRWRLLKVVPGTCAIDGQVDAVLLMAPPATWSRLGVAYRVRVKLLLAADTGEPAGAVPRHFKDLAAGVRRLVQRAEDDEDVRRFVERYPPRRADFSLDEGVLRVTYRAGAGTAPAAPRLVYSEARDAVTAYRIPRMDGLPARPELLRMIEVLSRHHAGCRPVQVSAEWKESSATPPAGSAGDTTGAAPCGRWQIDFLLEGAGCPVSFGGVVTPDRAVVDLRVSKAVHGGE